MQRVALPVTESPLEPIAVHVALQALTELRSRNTHRVYARKLRTATQSGYNGHKDVLGGEHYDWQRSQSVRPISDLLLGP